MHLWVWILPGTAPCAPAAPFLLSRCPPMAPPHPEYYWTNVGNAGEVIVRTPGMGRIADI